MTEEVRALILRSALCRGALRELSELLPEDDEELSQWIADAIAAADQGGFFWVTMAALQAGRALPAEHLALGWQLMPDHVWGACVAWHLQGDVAGALIQAVQATAMTRELGATALLVAAAKAQENGACPPELLTQARLFARIQDVRDQPKALLQATAAMIDDEGLWSVIEKQNGSAIPPRVQQAATNVGATILDTARRPFAEIVPEQPSRAIVQGRTMRRAVAKVGRNEPCPCGSGRKYKRCCAEADEERLSHSSEVAGLTAAELLAEPETDLTLARLERMLPSEMPRLDPLKVPVDLREPYLLRLGALRLHDALASAFEVIGCPPELVEMWQVAMFFVMRSQRPEIARRMVQVRFPTGIPDATTLRSGVPLLLAQDDPEEFLRILEESARAALETEDSNELESIAFGIFSNARTRALGVLVARSLIPLTEKMQALALFEQILQVRDTLGLPPEDPFEDVIDRRFTEEVAGKDARKLREAQRQLEAKAAETRQMSEKLAELRRDLAQREKRASAAIVKTAMPATADERVGELRGKIAELKGVLNERQAERFQLRRALETAHADLETLRHLEASRPKAVGEASEADEETATMEFMGNQPIRLIEFPPRFHAHLLDFPRQTASGALVALGKLAAGDPAAFVGIVALKQVPDALRIRIGSDYRLIFKLLPDRVQVLDLINRRDLDRRLKTL